MGPMAQAMRTLVEWVLRTSWQAAIIVGVVLLLQWIFERRLPARWRYGLWGLVVVRLMMPAMPGSRLSVYNLFSRSESRPVIVSATVVPANDFHPANPLANGVVLPPETLHEPAWWAGWDWRVIAGMVWLGGAMALAGAILQSHARLRRRIARGGVAGDARMLGVLNECKREMGVSRPVELVISDAISSPALMGLWRAKLLLPSSLARSLTPGELRFIFLHELAHHKCCDIALDWVLAGLRVIHWFNPILWLGLSRLRADRELARDAMVLSAAGEHHEEGYGQTILRLVEQFGHLETGLGAVGVVEGKGQLKRRMRMIAGNQRKTAGGATLGVALMLAVGCATLTGKKASHDDSAAALSPMSTTMPAAAQSRMDVALNQRLPAVRFEDAPFEQAISQLGKTGNVSFAVNWPEVEQAGVTRKSPVSTRMREVSLRKAIATVLVEAAGGPGLVDYVVEGDGITITSRAARLKNAPIRAYDIRDLLVDAPNGNHKALRAADILDLVRVVENVQNWPETGLPKVLNGILFVKALEEQHEEITSFLNDLREIRGLSIYLQMRVLTLPQGLLEECETNAGKRWATLSPITTVRGADGATTSRAELLDNDDVNQLLRAVQASHGAKIVSVPSVDAFNGQKALVQIGNEIPYIADLKPTKTQDGPTKYEPQMEKIFSGIKIGVQPTVSADRKWVTLKLEATLSEAVELQKVPFANAPVAQDLYTHKVVTKVQAVNASVTVPDTGTLLMVGTRSGNGGDSGAEAVDTVLLVKPSVIIKRDDNTPEFPLLKSEQTR